MNSCQSVQDGLTGKKRSKAMMNFVIKKSAYNATGFDKLPTPAGEENNIENDTIKLLEKIQITMKTPLKY